MWRGGRSVALGFALVLAGCASGGAVGAKEAAKPAPLTAEEVARARSAFIEAVDAFHLQTAAPATPSASIPEQRQLACQKLLPKAQAQLDASGVAYKTRDACSLDLLPNDRSRLGLAAKSLQQMTQGTLRYDLAFFLREPGVDARYDPATKVLFAPHGALIRSESIALSHELRRAEMRSKRSRGSNALAAFQAVLRGGRTPPAGLVTEDVYALTGDIVTLCDRLLDAKDLDPERLAVIDAAIVARRRPDTLLKDERYEAYFELRRRASELEALLDRANEVTTGLSGEILYTVSVEDGVTWAKSDVEGINDGGTFRGVVQIPGAISDNELEEFDANMGKGHGVSRKQMEKNLLDMRFRAVRDRLQELHGAVLHSLIPSLDEFARLPKGADQHNSLRDAQSELRARQAPNQGRVGFPEPME